MHRILVASALVLVLTPAVPAQTPPKPVKATPQNAAAFVGDCDLSGESANGPASFALSIKPDGQTLTAVLTKDDAPQTVNEISMVGSSLSLDATFFNAGSGYPALVTLTPSGDKIVLKIDAGVAQLNGTATRRIEK